MIALYMKDTRLQHKTIITKIGSHEINKKNYRWIQLTETIFHPKGGGQPSDEGFVGGIKVAYVHKDLNEIYHCFDMDEPFPFHIGDEVELLVDAPQRLLHSRLHTAGHVLAESANRCFPEMEAYQGNHYPNNSYVKFKIQKPLQTEDKTVLKQKIEETFISWIHQDIPVSERLDPTGIRTVKVFETWLPCGGTHVKSLKAIDGLKISDLSINKKESTITIKYACDALNKKM